jgi:superfamily II DNA or RNA helicase
MNLEKDLIQKNIVDNLPHPCHGLLNIAPRVGKTKITLDIIKKQKPKKILWVTPNTKLRDIDIPAEFKLWKMLVYFKKTDIICYASLAKHKGKYDLIILDEYQDLTPDNAKSILHKNVEYKNIIGLSGTHPKHKEKLDLYRELNLEVLVSMTIDEAVEKQLIAPYKITVIECELDNKDVYVKAGSASNPFFQTEVAAYKYLNKTISKKIENLEIVPTYMYLNRMRFIYNLKSKNDFAKKLVSNLPGRTLVFTGSIKQAEAISPFTYHSKTKDTHLNNFLEGKSNILTCVNAGGIGFTYKNVNNFVIVQVNSDKKGDATQKITRSLVLQEGYEANIYVLVVKDTVDVGWKDKVLESFDLSKVTCISYKNYE